MIRRRVFEMHEEDVHGRVREGFCTQGALPIGNLSATSKALALRFRSQRVDRDGCTGSTLAGSAGHAGIRLAKKSTRASDCSGTNTFLKEIGANTGWKRLFDPLNCAWMLLACVEVAGFAYLLLAISNAARAGIG